MSSEGTEYGNVEDHLCENNPLLSDSRSPSVFSGEGEFDKLVQEFSYDKDRREIEVGIPPPSDIAAETDATDFDWSYCEKNWREQVGSTANKILCKKTHENFDVVSGRYPPMIEPEPAPEQGSCSYVLELLRYSSDSTSLRGRQARLTLWELLEHFDMCNDLIFIFRVAITICLAPNGKHTNPGFIAITWLVCIWLTSVASYLCRRFIIYHRVDDTNLSIFSPLYVFAMIRDLGDRSPETLYMFERLVWTYQIIMRVLEDIPQVICSAIFLSNFGRDFYTYFMIAYSLLLVLLTSYRMGVMYPLLGTLSLAVSRRRPVDSPVLNEAANVTSHFWLFLASVSGGWLLTSLFCLLFANGFALLTCLAGAPFLAFVSFYSASYYVHLNQCRFTENENFDRIPPSATPLSDNIVGTGLGQSIDEPLLSEVGESIIFLQNS